MMTILSIKEWQRLNEVRIPTGKFKVVDTFRLPGLDNCDEIFNQNDIIEINPESRSIKKWSDDLDKWVQKEVDWKELIKPEVYSVLKMNTTKQNTESEQMQFKTTVKGFNKAAEKEGLGPNDKVNVSYQPK